MNILILNWRDPKNPKSGGAEIVTLEHAKAWVEKGHHVTWLATKFRGAKKEEVIDNIQIIRKGNIITQFILFALYYFHHKQEVDLVIDEIHGVPYMTPLYVKKKKLAFIHEVAGNIWDVMFPLPFNKLGQFFERISFFFYRDVPFLTVSESTKDDIKDLGIKDVTVIHNGVYKVKAGGEKEKNPTFIFVSRLVKMKGIEDILSAFQIIHHNSSTSQLWIVGKGDKGYEKKLKKYVADHQLANAVRFFGYVDQNTKYDLLRRSHLLLHASKREGWGLVVLEGASQMTPSVVYNASGLKDAVKDGETGVIVRDNTPQALASAVLSLIKDISLYQKMQKEAKNWADSLTWENATKQSLELIESL